MIGGINYQSPFYKIHLCAGQLILLCLGLGYTLTSPAHGPGQHAIEEITLQITQQGGTAALYIKRAHIYQNNQHWEQAMSDFNQAAQLAPEDVELDLDRARLSYQAGNYLRSLDFIELYLLRHKHSIDALLIKARSLRSLGQVDKAVVVYRLAMEQISAMHGSASAEWYMEVSETLVSAGKPEEAVRVLQQGIDELGYISVLMLKAIQLEVKLKRYESALQRIDRIIAQAQRKDSWLMRRADILQLAGRHEEALETYEQAYVALQKLPLRLKNLPVSREMEAKLQTRLAQ